MNRSELPLAGWGLIAVAAAAMGTAGLYQFGWSSLRLPVGQRVGVPEPSLGTAFTLFVASQTVGQFPAGWVRDRHGPRLPLLAGAVGTSAGFLLLAVADSVGGLYTAFIVGGLGASSTYTVAVNTAVKWFDARRGLASGVVTMSYSGVSFLAIPVIRERVDVAFQSTVFGLAVLAGGASLVAAVVLRDPDPASGGHEETESAAETAPQACGWRTAVRTWQFWLLYVVFVLVNGVGLMIIGKVVAFADVLSLSPAVATASASAVALADAGGVLLGGSLSDRFGRRHTVATSLLCCGLALGLAVVLGRAGNATGFLVAIGAAALFRSPPFAVFPTLVGEYYGAAYSSENYAALYTGKLFGGVFGGTVASGLVVSLGWTESFLLGAVGVALAGGLLFLLRPVERAAVGSPESMTPS